MSLAPILLFTYNRLSHTKNTIKALQRNPLSKESHLYIFSDAPRTEKDEEKVREVRMELKKIRGFQETTIVERDSNFGLGNNIIEGVTQIVNKYGKVIVMEDDLVSSPFFLEYMNKALSMYENNEQVISIHGYVYPTKNPLPETFFLRNADCLGWGTWKRGWDYFERDGNLLLKQLIESQEEYLFNYNDTYPYTAMLQDFVEGRNNSWAIRWYASAFLKNKYTLYPGRSLIFHSGGDGTGTNTGFDNHLDVNLSTSPIEIHPIKVEQNAEAYHSFVQFFANILRPSILYRVRRRLKKIFHS
ncbi:MAG: sugar transferase [Flavitalea sp.]